jgi:hypothetical protein
LFVLYTSGLGGSVTTGRWYLTTEARLRLYMREDVVDGVLERLASNEPGYREPAPAGRKSTEIGGGSSSCMRAAILSMHPVFTKEQMCTVRRRFPAGPLTFHLANEFMKGHGIRVRLRTLKASAAATVFKRHSVRSFFTQSCQL